jgi:ParB family chromosome partitioning protein
MARRSGLGKGLGALIPTENADSAQEGALREVAIGSIRANTFQPRDYFDEDRIAQLADSIREIGVLQPILVREIEDEPGTFELIAGERRLRASKRAGLSSIPVLVRTAINDQESLEQALVENIHRADLSALEEAAGYQQLIDEFGLTHDEVSTRVGKSRTTVTNTLRLLQLPESVKVAIKEGRISAGHGRSLLGTPDRILQESLVEVIEAQGLSVRQTEALVRGEILEGIEAGDDGGAASRAAGGVPPRPTPRRTAPRPLPPAGFTELEELLSNYLNTRCTVDVTGRKGRLVVDFSDIADLERIYRHIIPSQG